MGGWWNSQNTYNSYQVHCLICVWFLAPQNNYSSNIKDHWSEITVTNIITIIKKVEMLHELPKCYSEMQSEQMLLENGSNRLAQQQGCHKFSIFKKYSICEVQ